MFRFEVMLRYKGKGDRWSLMFSADDFGHAEEQAVNYLDGVEGKGWGKYWEIVRIEKDYA